MSKEKEKEKDQVPPTVSGASSTSSTSAHPGAESKASRFRRVGNLRLTKVLRALQGLIPLANKGGYEYTNEQVSNLLNALNNGVAAVSAAFAGKQIGGIL